MPKLIKTTPIIACIILFLLVSCGSKQTKPKVTIPDVEIETSIPKEEETTVAVPELPDYAPLIFSVQLGIHPLQKNWVLYKNGTYMLFKDALGEEVLTEAAHKRMAQIKNPKATSIKKSAMAKGWIVSFGTTGIYNYVAYKQIEAGIPGDQEIMQQAIANLLKDRKKLKAIKVNQE